MSFVNSGRSIQRFIQNQKYNTPVQEIIKAVIDARKFNSTIREEATDFEFGEGKLRQLKVSYYAQDCDVLDNSLPSNICVTGAVAEPKQDFFQIADFTKSKAKTLNVSDLRYIDASDSYDISANAMSQVNSMIGSLEVGLAKQITAKLYAHRGIHLDGSTFGQRITMDQTTNGLMTPVGLWAIQKEMSDGAYANPFIIGSTEVWNWRKAYAIASDNTTLGQDFSKINIPNLYYDINLNSVTGATAATGEYIIAADPESFKFVTFNRNAGMFATDFKGVEDLDRAYKSGGRYQIRGTFVSPRTGLMWDFYANFNGCTGLDGAWSWFLMLQWDIVFPVVQTCNIQGVNGIMVYKTCPVVIPDCPTGTAQSPAWTSRAFNWVPGSIYSPALYIAKLTIGGVTTYPNVTANNITDLIAVLNANSQSGVTFSQAGAAITYTGYTSITGSINDGSISIAFV